MKGKRVSPQPPLISAVLLVQRSVSPTEFPKGGFKTSPKIESKKKCQKPPFTSYRKAIEQSVCSELMAQGGLGGLSLWGIYER